MVVKHSGYPTIEEVVAACKKIEVPRIEIKVVEVKQPKIKAGVNTKPCLQCGENFVPVHKNQRNCSEKCQKDRKRENKRTQSRARYWRLNTTEPKTIICRSCGVKALRTSSNQKRCVSCADKMSNSSTAQRRALRLGENK